MIDATAARQLFLSAENGLRDVERKYDDVQRKLNLNYGRQDEFAKLEGQCFEIRSGEYIYELCPFGSATQKNEHGSRVAGLGEWEDWGKDGQVDYRLWKFVHGDQCWNGPQRSLTVRVTCGTDNVILSVMEPQKCEYEMSMQSPSVCDEASVARPDRSEL